VLDTAAGVWCDTKSVVTTPRTGRYSADAAGGDASVELTRRCRHAAAAVGDLIFVYGGLRGGNTRILACPIPSMKYDKSFFPSVDLWALFCTFAPTCSVLPFLSQNLVVISFCFKMIIKSYCFKFTKIRRNNIDYCIMFLPLY
jgi:hypothetical protein